jgi:alpha,alpha-trehalase
MKLPHLLFLPAFAASVAQVPAPVAPDSAATIHFIHGAWDSLTRSAADCQSLADTKIAGGNTEPALYVPADILMPAEVAALQQSCRVRVLRLPRPIEKLGDVRPEELSAPGLLYLPLPYIVPGGRFNEMYGWDSFLLFSDWKRSTAKLSPKASSIISCLR